MRVRRSSYDLTFIAYKLRDETLEAQELIVGENKDLRCHQSLKVNISQEMKRSRMFLISIERFWVASRLNICFHL